MVQPSSEPRRDTAVELDPELVKRLTAPVTVEPEELWPSDCYEWGKGWAKRWADDEKKLREVNRLINEAIDAIQSGWPAKDPRVASPLSQIRFLTK